MGQTREIIDHFFGSPETTDSQTVLIAVYFAFGQTDVCLPTIFQRKDVHGEIDGHFAFHFHGNNLMIHHIVVAMIHATAVQSFPKLVFDDIVDSLAFRHIEIGNPITAHLIEVDSREWTSTFYPTINASLR